MSTLADRFKQLRLSLNMNQKSFALELNMSQAHISKIEHGQDFPSDKLLKQVAATFDVNFNWLKTGEGEMIINEVIQEDSEVYSSDQDTLLLKIQNLTKDLTEWDREAIADILLSLKFLVTLQYKSDTQRSLAIKSTRDIFCYTYLFLIERYAMLQSQNLLDDDRARQGEIEWKKICEESLQNLKSAFLCE